MSWCSYKNAHYAACMTVFTNCPTITCCFVRLSTHHVVDRFVMEEVKIFNGPLHLCRCIYGCVYVCMGSGLSDDITGGKNLADLL